MHKYEKLLWFRGRTVRGICASRRRKNNSFLPLTISLAMGKLHRLLFWTVIHSSSFILIFGCLSWNRWGGSTKGPLSPCLSIFLREPLAIGIHESKLRLSTQKKEATFERRALRLRLWKCWLSWMLISKGQLVPKVSVPGEWGEEGRLPRCCCFAGESQTTSDTKTDIILPPCLKRGQGGWSLDALCSRIPLLWSNVAPQQSCKLWWWFRAELGRPCCHVIGLSHQPTLF